VTCGRLNFIGGDMRSHKTYSTNSNMKSHELSNGYD